MKKIVIVIGLVLAIASPSYAVNVTFSLTDRQVLIAEASAKVFYKGKITGKQLMKRHLLEIINSYKYQLKEARSQAMTDQEEMDMLNDFNQ